LLTDNVSKSEELLGGQRSDPSDLMLKREVLTAPRSRADDFGWPRTHAGDTTAEQSNEAMNELASQSAKLIDFGSANQLALPYDERRPNPALQSTQ
jgi:hypothetical protein